MTSLSIPTPNPEVGGIPYPRAFPQFLLSFLAQSMNCGVPKRIRTSDPKVRNLVLYPTELPRHIIIVNSLNYTAY